MVVAEQGMKQTQECAKTKKVESYEYKHRYMQTMQLFQGVNSHYQYLVNKHKYTRKYVNTLGSFFARLDGS